MLIKLQGCSILYQIKELADSQIRVNSIPLNTYKNSSVVDNREDSGILSEVNDDVGLN